MPDTRFWLICLSIADWINFKRFISPILMTIMSLSAIITSLLIGNNYGFILGHFYFGTLGHYHFGGTLKTDRIINDPFLSLIIAWIINRRMPVTGKTVIGRELRCFSAVNVKNQALTRRRRMIRSSAADKH